jgi:hypothetical protein
MAARVTSFERDRALYVRSIGQRFDFDGMLKGVTSETSDLEFVERSATGAVVLLREMTWLDWVPNPRPVSPSAIARRAAEPERFDTPQPRGVVRSGVASRHEIRLDRSSSGWVATFDAYSEPNVFGSSPDVAASPVITSEAATANRQVPIEDTGPAAGGAPEVTAAIAVGSQTYNYLAAVNYAATYWSSYNANYNACGGDCTNFVSQCFYKGRPGRRQLLVPLQRVGMRLLQPLLRN